jgi:Mce-associated membrane protein
VVSGQTEQAGPPRRRRRIAGLALAGLLIGALWASTAIMGWQHYRVAARHAEQARIIEAARDAVTALLTIDHTTAKADVQRVLDATVGPFHDDFDKSANDFVATAEKSNAVTKGSIKAAALQSETTTGGVVIVAAASEVTNASGARADARPFRMSVTVSRDGDQYKMSNLEFVP